MMCVSVRLRGRPGSLLCTGLPLQTLIRPLSCFSLAWIDVEEETHAHIQYLLLRAAFLLSVYTFQFSFSPLIPPLCVALSFDTAHLFLLRFPPFLHSFTRCLLSLGSFPPFLAAVCLSCLATLSQRPVSQPAADLTTTFCRSAIRIGRCLKTTSEGTFGSLCLACLIPEQLFIYNGTLVFAPPCRAEQIWGQRRKGAKTCDICWRPQIEAKQRSLQSAEIGCFFSWCTHNLKWALSDIDKTAAVLMWQGHLGSMGVKG